MVKRNWKKYFIFRLKVATFILALVGWFMLVIVPLEKYSIVDLTSLESFAESVSFRWGIKVCFIILLIVLLRAKDRIDKIISKNYYLRIVLRLIYIVGGIGWVIGLMSL